MKWKTNWKKALRNGICVGTLLLFLFQFAAMAQEGGAAAQEEPSKISPLLLEAFAQQPAPMSLDAQAESPTVPAAVWVTDADLTEASAWRRPSAAWKPRPPCRSPPRPPMKKTPTRCRTT